MLNNNKITTANSILKDFVKKALALKYIYIISVVTFIIIAFMLNKYSPNIYEVQAKLLLRNNDQEKDLEKVFRNTPEYNSKSSLEDEIDMLKSYSLVNATISALNLEIGLFSEEKGLFTTTKELYDRFPYLIVFDKSHPQPIDVPIQIIAVSDTTYRLVAQKEKVSMLNYLDNRVNNVVPNFNVNQVFRFNETITTDYFKFTISLKNKDDLQFLKQNTQKLTFQFFYYDYLTLSYLNSLRIESLSPLASIIKISFKGRNIKRINDFLNKYLELYLENSLSRRNKIAQSTIDFIDDQISDISDSLKTAETVLRDYRSSNQVVDMGFQGQRIYDQMGQIETQKANMLTQKRYYTYIIDYLKKSDSNLNPALPSSSNVVDPILSQLIMDLTKFISEKQEIINDSKKNLYLPQIENKIEKQKETILENITNNLNTLNISINEMDYRYNKLSAQISNLPKTELRLVGINRQYKLNDAIFTYLLQRKAESQISKASNLPDSEIVEPSRESTAYITYPKKRINYLISIFLAIFFPSCFILLRDFFNDKISSSYQLESIVGQQILGTIYKNKYKTNNVVMEKPNSYIAESFRTLRTHLFIKMGKEPSKAILLTSSIPQEGKSFISLNLATAISMLGYKTILVDCDLRRPSLHTRLKTENNLGVTNYLTDKAVLEDIILNVSNNLDFICAGPTLPNPTELLESTKCENLFQMLKHKYQYIIIDTPPIGAISDSLLLMKHAQYTLFVSRFNYTKKGTIYDVSNQLVENNIKDFHVVLNDVEFTKTEYGGYYKKYYSAEKKS